LEEEGPFHVPVTELVLPVLVRQTATMEAGLQIGGAPEQRGLNGNARALRTTEAVEGAAGHTGDVVGVESMDTVGVVQMAAVAADSTAVAADIEDMQGVLGADIEDTDDEDHTPAEGTAAAAAVVEERILGGRESFVP
jgi:hypothetical protein